MQSAELEITITAEDSDIARAQKSLDELNKAAASGVEFDIDGSKAEKEIAEVGRLFEKVITEAETVAEIEIATKDAERELKRLGDLAEKSGDRTEDAYKDASKVIRAEATKIKKAIDDATDPNLKGIDGIADRYRKAAKESGQAMNELGDEAKQNLSEVTSSFDGSATGLVDMVQGTLGGVVGAMGPAGMAIGAGLAVGIGIGVAKLEEMAEKINTTKEEAGALAAEIGNSGVGIESVDVTAKLREWSGEIQDNRSWWEVWQTDAVSNLENLEAGAQKAGINVGALMQTLSQGGAAGVQNSIDMYQEIKGEYDALASSGRDLTEAERSRRDGLKQTKEALYDMVAPMAEAAQQYLTTEAYITGLTEAEIMRRDEMLNFDDAQQKRAESLADLNDLETLHAEALVGSGAAMDVYNDLMDDQLDLIREVAGEFQSYAEAQADYHETLSGMSDAQAKINDLMAQGQSVLNATGDGFNHQTEAGRLAQDTMFGLSDSIWDVIEAQREQGASAEELQNSATGLSAQFVTQAMEMGFSAQAARELANELGLIPSEIASTAIVDVERKDADELEAALAEADGKTVEPILEVDVERQAFDEIQAALNAEEGKRRKTIWEIVAEGLTTAQAKAGAQKKAGGGYVTGGIPGVDSVPVLAMPDEFVIRKSAADALGPDVLAQLNQGRLPSSPSNINVGSPNINVDTGLAGAISELTGLLKGGINANISHRQLAEAVSRASNYGRNRGGR